jgi:SNF family Na+-dependent transporter
LSFNIIGWCLWSNHELNFCFPPHWWLLCQGEACNLEVQVCCRVTWKLVLGDGLLVNSSSTLSKMESEPKIWSFTISLTTSLSLLLPLSVSLSLCLSPSVFVSHKHTCEEPPLQSPLQDGADIRCSNW